MHAVPVRNNNFQFGERVTWSSGKHSVKFGGDARKFNWDMLGFFQNRGYFQFTTPITSRTSLADGTGNALASFLLGTPALAQRQAGTPSMVMRQMTYAAFIQDDWRVSPALTINAGLRYELQTPLHDISKILTNLDFSKGAPVAFVGGQNGYPRASCTSTTTTSRRASASRGRPAKRRTCCAPAPASSTRTRT